ncbi:MAG TPA: HigA family addiction module antitoxin [Chthoniobacterales bacterium]
MDNRLNPVHPGEVLEEEFLKPLGITKYRLAQALHVSATRIGEIVTGSPRDYR